MAAGFRSLAAPWIGGLAGGGNPAGFRSLFAPWIGGLSHRPPAAGPPGFRSLAGFWIGGLGSNPDLVVVPPEPQPEPPVLAGGPGRPPLELPHHLFAEQDDEEAVLMAIVAAIIHLQRVPKP